MDVPFDSLLFTDQPSLEELGRIDADLHSWTSRERPDPPPRWTTGIAKHLYGALAVKKRSGGDRDKHLRVLSFSRSLRELVLSILPLFGKPPPGGAASLLFLYQRGDCVVFHTREVLLDRTTMATAITKMGTRRKLVLAGIQCI